MAGFTERHCFLEENNGLASLLDIKQGYYCHNNHLYPQHGFVSRTLGYATFHNNTDRGKLSSVSSPRFGRFYDARYEDHQPHFLEACFLCKNPLGNNREIFMYRGDMPFCSKECRQEQIDIDKAKEKNMSISSSMKALSKMEKNKYVSPNKTHDYSFRKWTIAVA